MIIRKHVKLECVFACKHNLELSFPNRLKCEGIDAAEQHRSSCDAADQAPLAIEVPAMALGVTNASSGSVLLNLSVPALNLSSGAARTVGALASVTSPDGTGFIEEGVQALVNARSFFLDACLTGGVPACLPAYLLACLPA